MKLYEKKYSSLPPSSPKQEAAPKAAAAITKHFDAKPSKDDDDISDDYEDDFGSTEDKKEAEKKPLAKDADSDEEKDSEWDLDELMNGGGSKKVDTKDENKGIGSYVDQLADLNDLDDLDDDLGSYPNKNKKPSEEKEDKFN